MSNLFKKAAVFTDIHFGMRNNSLVHNTDCLEFIDWMIETARAEGCETAIFLGDWTHSRASVNIQTLQFSLRGLEKLSQGFEQVYFIVGNHDLFYRDRRDIYSSEWAKYIPNIHIVDEWFTSGDVTIVPWLIGDEHKRVQKINSKYVFGHFELPHFKMNANVVMPDHGSIQESHFSGVDRVFSGHFHMRQQRGNIHYIGNCFPHNYGDSGDDRRGMMILEWGSEPEYRSWPRQPLYRVLPLSDILVPEMADQLLQPRMNCRVEIDVSLSYEEASFVKEEFIKKYELREMSLVPVKKNVVDTDLAPGELHFESVDQVVINQISNLESDYYDPQLLLSIYQALH